MKKYKVNKLIQQFSAQSRVEGIAQGIKTERSKWECLLPIRGDSNVTWLDNRPPDKLRTVAVLEPTSERYFPIDPDAMFMSSRGYQRIDFEPIPMALSLATGQQIRWFHWKPIGPYPVTELAVMR